MIDKFPVVRRQWKEVKEQLETLRCQRDEIESADQEELRRVREEISIVNEVLETRRTEIQLQGQEAEKLAFEEMELRRQMEDCRVKIDRAERVKELNRGFDKNEVEGFKGLLSRVDTVLMVETLGCLRDVSGWEVVRVFGRDIQMEYKNDITVSFNVDELRRGGSAKVEIPNTSDLVHTFTYSTLTTLKGDIPTVPLSPPSTDL